MRGEERVPIDLEMLKAERDALKVALRETEAEQRKVEGEFKRLRQAELQMKREIEALTTLIEVGEGRKPREEGEALDAGPQGGGDL